MANQSVNPPRRVNGYELEGSSAKNSIVYSKRLKNSSGEWGGRESQRVAIWIERQGHSGPAWIAWADEEPRGPMERIVPDGSPTTKKRALQLALQWMKHNARVKKTSARAKGSGSTSSSELFDNLF